MRQRKKKTRNKGASVLSLALAKGIHVVSWDTRGLLGLPLHIADSAESQINACQISHSKSRHIASSGENRECCGFHCSPKTCHQWQVTAHGHFPGRQRDDSAQRKRSHLTRYFGTLAAGCAARLLRTVAPSAQRRSVSANAFARGGAAGLVPSRWENLAK